MTSAAQIQVGLKFKSKAFTADCEISAVRRELNQCDVTITPSDGNEWEEKDWKLDTLATLFAAEHYYIPEREVNFGV